MSIKAINWFEERNKNQFDEATQLKSNFQPNQILIKIKMKWNLKKIKKIKNKIKKEEEEEERERERERAET